jgi:DNA-binding NtrC family response regulator
MVSGKVLLIDDEVDLVEILAEEFRLLGLECVTAYEPLTAIQMIPQFHPDAIVSDINMPKMSGLDLLSHLKNLGLEIPFIFLTGFGDERNLVKALKLGAFDFMQKPQCQEELNKITLLAVEAGKSLKLLETELQELCEKAGVFGDDLLKYKRIRRVLMISKKYNEVRKKAA